MAQLAVADYYRIPAVRRRIREYCGGSEDHDLTCLFLTGISPAEQSGWTDAGRHSPAELDALFEAGAEISRSMWDAENLLVHLDLDYQHVDRPAEALAHPADMFVKVEPARRTVQQLLDEFEMPLLTVMTGRGYHFTGRIPLDAPLIDVLSALAPVPSWLATCPARRPSWAAATVSGRVARAHSALGLLVEYLAHETMRRAAPHSRIPVVVNGTVVGSGLWGRECTSLDFSYAGDPLDVRHMRVAFSAYQAHYHRHDGAPAAPTVVAIPMGTRTLLDLLESGREPEAAAALAAETSAEIPIVTRGAARLFEAYRASSLSTCHRDFYATAPEPAASWPSTYDRLDPASLPPCASASLLAPNDLLLKPEHIQHVTRCLMSAGWHPRHVAGLIHSRYARDFQWGTRWSWMDAQTRAEFDVRVFAGMIATGLDEAIDFNCRSTQEKGLCPSGPFCAHDLRQDRDRLRRKVHP